MGTYDFEVRKYTGADLDLQPECFANQQDNYSRLKKFCHYGMLFPDGVEQKPLYYIRNCEPNGFRWAGILNFGNGPLEPQTSIHHADLAQANTSTSGFRKVSDRPVTYEIKSKNPFAEIRFSENGGVWKEGDILDLKFEPFPYALFSHSNPSQMAPFWQQHVLLSGTYHGKPVKGMGGFDKTYAVDGKEEEMYKKTYTYMSALYSGIREDGRKESMYALISFRNGEGTGFYYIDGEDPIVSDKVSLEADWHHMPYLPKEDKTVVYTNAVWKFGGKEFHFIAKWGAKGFTATPNIAKYGQSQCFGAWYEGETPYQHKLYHTFNESSDATEDRISGMGFEILD